ncbi:non-ribosomal peptide synthetase [Tahibacter amnicola]|uniref:AMP-binding protein n=1 Tax=Tahibacter amnicola TaxID=2976241 RepID=A0ABY6BCB0_9GAMM|nr:condensation domain-containing protein [Tahibacter amnicola]UXI66266.1 AMP-binding protein [Tahibacter amnicola]
MNAHVNSELTGAQRSGWQLAPALAGLGEYGDALAVEDGTRSVDFATFARHMDCVAAALRADYPPDAVVAVDIERSLELVLALCACLRAGRAFVIVSGTHALDRARMANAGAILRANPGTSALLRIEPLSPVAAQPLQGRESDGDLAYVLYTSGSTGTPKGVEVRRDGLCNYLAWAARHYDMDALEGAVAHLNPAFDAAITQLLLPIVRGRCVHIVAPGREITGLVASLDYLRGRWLVKLTPSQVAAIAVERGASVFESSGELVLGGEALLGDVQRAAAALFPRYRIHNEYGPTETVVGSTIYTASVARYEGSLPIGTPIDATSIRIVDAWLRPVVHGETGEILIAGAGVARGYRGLPRRTAEGFVPDPAASQPGARAYRTGDYGYVDAQGYLRYVGRRDEQVKIRGHRVELGDVRARVQALAGVAEAAVEAVALPDGDRELRAYVRLETGTTLAGLRASAQQHLPEPLRPAHWFAVAQMPLTANGKLDTAHLAVLADTAPVPAVDVDATTATVLRLWSALLQHGDFGPDDDFHAVGGHSLLAIRLRGQIRKQFGASIPLATLIALSTPRRIAGAIDAAMAGADVATPPAAAASEVTDAPLSPLQQPLWRAALNARRRGLADPYLVPVALRLHGSVDEERLRAAFAGVIARHGIFHTTLAWDGEAIRQRVGQDPLWEWHRESPLDVALRIRQIAAEPLDLERGPVVAVHALREPSGSTCLVLRLHHLFIDEWSTSRLIDELSTAYTHGVAALPSPPPRDAYAAFSARQHAVSAERNAVQLNYWARVHADAPALPELPRRSGTGTAGVLRRSTRLDSASTEALRAAAAAQQVSMHTLVLAAIGMALGIAADLPLVRIAVPMAVRDDDALHGVCGYFLNSVLYTVPVERQRRMVDIVRDVGARSTGVLENKDVAFEQVIAATPAMASGAHSHVRFVYSEWLPTPDFGGDCRVEYVPVERAGVKFPLLISAQAGPDGLELHLDADTAVYEEAHVRQWTDHCRALLTFLAEDPARDMASIRSALHGQRQAEQQARTQSLAARLAGAGRRSVTGANSVAEHPASPDGLHCVSAPSLSTSLRDWITQHASAIHARISQHGAVLFRGFAELPIEEFEACVGLLGQGAMVAYENRSTPRTQVRNHVYTSTEYPADAQIPLHSENAYSARWPERIMFWSREVAATGGETPIADNRRVLAAIPDVTLERFQARGVMYVRNYHRGIGLSWQETFQTAARDEVESYCRAHAMQWQWLQNDVLRTWQTLPAVRTHSPTGARVWFNQAHLFHVSSLGAAVERDLRQLFDEQSLPRNACFGDGSPIAADDLEAIRRAYAANEVVFGWQRNDLLVLDNQLYSHGRRSYTGARRVLAGMTGTGQDAP